MIDANGSGRRKIVNDDGCPQWSPKGNRFAYLSHRDRAIHIVDARTGSSRKLVADVSPFAWSPSGSEIAFPSSGRIGITLVGVSDGRARVVNVRGEHCVDPSLSHVTWAPGRSILFEVDCGDPPRFVYMIRPDGTHERNLTPKRQESFVDSWSPDGRKIAFGTLVGQIPTLFVANADGSGATNISGAQGGSGAVWSPDSRMLVYQRNSDLYAVGVDGRGRRLIWRHVADNASGPVSTAWQPQ